MALEFICDETLEYRKKIKIPKDANCYTCKSGKIKFFKSNPENRFNKIPESAKGISFEVEFNRYNINYGEPTFYNNEMI